MGQFTPCLLVEHGRPASRLRARRGILQQSWLRRDRLAEALEEMKSVEPDAGGGRTRIKAHRSRCRFGHLAIKLPGLFGDETWNRTVLRHRADKLLLTPVPEQVIGGHRKPPSRVSVGQATIRQSCHTCAGCRFVESDLDEAQSRLWLKRADPLVSDRSSAGWPVQNLCPDAALPGATPTALGSPCNIAPTQPEDGLSPRPSLPTSPGDRVRSRTWSRCRPGPRACAAGRARGRRNRTGCWLRRIERT